MLLQEGGASAAKPEERKEVSDEAVAEVAPEILVQSAPPCRENPEKSFDEKCSYFASKLPFLTPTEHIIYEFYLKGTNTKEIMAELNIKENTLKYHNKNIYGKLGVSSRKQLMEIALELQKADASADK